eukprot:900730-Amphidinium_carterae.1
MSNYIILTSTPLSLSCGLPSRKCRGYFNVVTLSQWLRLERFMPPSSMDVACPLLHLRQGSRTRPCEGEGVTAKLQSQDLADVRHRHDVTMM